MNCLVPGNNLKVLAKAVQALHRISDEMFIECRKDYIKFSVMNTNHTSYACYTFQSLFFLHYTLTSEDVTCKLYTQGLNIIKANMEKDVDSCKINLEPEAEHIDFVIKYKTEASVSYRRHLLTFDHLKFNYDPDKMLNKVSSSAEILSDMLCNFHARDCNFHMDVTDDKVVFRNFGTATTSSRGVRSTMSINSGEFAEYSIKRQCNCVMSLKTFKSLIVFAEVFHLNVNLHFTCGGKPLVATMSSPTFTVDYVLATVDPDSNASTQSSGTLSGGGVGGVGEALNEDDLSTMRDVNWEMEMDDDDANLNSSYRFSITNDTKLMNVFKGCFDDQKRKKAKVGGLILAENSDSDWSDETTTTTNDANDDK